MQEKPALFQALRNRREGFLVIPPVIFTPPRGPEPTPSSNKPSGSESNISIRGGGGGGGGRKKRLQRADQHSEISRGQVLAR